MALTAKDFIGGGKNSKKKRSSSSKKAVQFAVPNDPSIDMNEGPQGNMDRIGAISESQDASVAGTSETRLASSDANPSESRKGGRNIEIGPPTTDRLGNPLEDGAAVAAAARFGQRPPQAQGTDAGDPPEHIKRLLGPVEVTRRDKNQGEGAGVDMDGPLPAWMEKKRLGVEAMGVATQASRPHQAQQQQMAQQMQQQKGGSSSGIATVNVINHTDSQLTLIAVEPRNGQRVDKTLYPKQSDSFDAPMGCLISVINPVTERALFRHKVLEPMTTLAVTDAILLRDGEVGSTGKWWDSRAFCIAAGVVGTTALVGAVLLVVFLIHRAQKQGAAKSRSRRGSF